MDTQTTQCIRQWAEWQFEGDEVEIAYSAIMDFLAGCDAEDQEYWLQRDLPSLLAATGVDPVAAAEHLIPSSEIFWEAEGWVIA